jgi:hypothetical protein
VIELLGEAVPQTRFALCPAAGQRLQKATAKPRTRKPRKAKERIWEAVTGLHISIHAARERAEA